MSIYWTRRRVKEKLNQIVELFPSLSSRVATLENDLLFLNAITYWMLHRSREDFLVQQSYDKRFHLIVKRILHIELNPCTLEATMDNLITDFMLNLEDIKSATKELFSIHLGVEYETYEWRQDAISTFVDSLAEVRVDSNEEAITSVQNLKAYRDFTKYLANVCRRKEALVPEIWLRARAVADHTAIFLYSCLFEPDTNLNLKLTHLLQMTDPTHPLASAFYFKIFNSMSFSHQIPFPHADEMNFIDHLLLVLKNQIIQCQECQAIFACEKLMAWETLVKAIVSYSPLSTKIILYGSIMKHATTVLSFSFPIDSEEKNLYQSFDGFLETLVMSGFIGHLLHYGNKSLKDQLEKFSEYMTLLKAMVSYPPLRYLFSKIILHKFIVKLVIIVSSLPSIDPTKVEDDTGKEKNLVLLAEFDVAYKKFMVDVEDIQNLRLRYLRDIPIGEQKIGQYIDYLEEVQKEYLSSNKQAIISVQNLRSFQHLSKVIVNWNRNEDLLNKVKRQLQVVFEHTTKFLCSCWLEPEEDQDLKLTQLLQMTTIKNAKVHRIYVQGFKTLEESVYSPWKNELAEASFIEYMIFYLKELIQCQTRSLVASSKEQLENLHRYLTILRNTIPVKDIVPSSQHQHIIPIWMRNTVPVNDIPSKMRALHSLVIKFVMKMASISITDSEDAEEENLALLHDLEENITLMKTEFRKLFLFDYPSIGFEFFSLFENLKEMMTFKSDVISPMKHQFDMVYTGLLELRSVIKDKSTKNKEQVKDLWRRVAQVSHMIECHFRSYVNGDVKNGPTFYHSMQLPVVIEDIKLLITELEGHDTDNSNYGTAEETYEQGSSFRSTPNVTDMVVGFEDQSQAILEHIIGRSESRNIVAIVGMPGLGKTTIAKKVYNHPSVANRFDRRGWCCVSQSFQKKELLLQLLRSITKVNDDGILKKSDDEIGAMLSKSLKKRRYLIVLDDVWETKAWEDLKRSFPDDNNESRVIITSRDRQVAHTLIQATPYSYLHPLRDFKDEESFKLLQHKLFPQHGFPNELSDSGKMIAQQCRGLPLAVVLTAGILSRMKKIEDCWVTFGESLSTQIVNEPGNQCKALIELSYAHLPDHLKCCFLYFGAFPEDEEISARKLIWLWIAEGFIRDANAARLEDIAEQYLMDLIGRSLVIGSKSVSRPGIKSCHVHDLLHEFCLAKAKEEHFLRVVHGYDKYLPLDNIHVDFGVHLSRANDPSKVTHSQYRLSIYSKRNHFILAKPSGPNVRTLFFHALADMYPNCPYEASFIFRYFKLIKVLDLGSINIGDSLAEVALMLHLTYLEVKGNTESIPISIGNLLRLETFILKGLRIPSMYVPSSIWGLLRLRHLHIDGYTSIKFNTKEFVDSTILADMESFSTPTISYGDEVEKLLRRLPNLRKLKCVFLDSWDSIKKCNRFPVLEFLTQLVSLKVSCHYRSFHPSRRYPCRFSLPSNLTKLTISELGLPWSEISEIGKLPNLNSLKLLSRAFTGKIWDMSEGEFLSLEFLKLESLDIEEWTATDAHIPCLQRLILSKCKKLKEVPSEIGDINTLEIIDLRWCTRSAATSARSIQETAEENGNDSLKVHIYPNEKNPGASS